MGDARWACPGTLSVTLTCPHDMQHFVFYTVHSLLSFYYVPAIFYYFLFFQLILIISCLRCSFSDSSTILNFNVDLPLSYFSAMISVISILLSCLSFPPSHCRLPLVLSRLLVHIFVTAILAERVQWTADERVQSRLLLWTLVKSALYRDFWNTLNR